MVRSAPSGRESAGGEDAGAADLTSGRNTASATRKASAGRASEEREGLKEVTVIRLFRYSVNKGRGAPQGAPAGRYGVGSCAGSVRLGSDSNPLVGSATYGNVEENALSF